MAKTSKATVPQLEVRNLSKTFVTGRPVLQAAEFTIASGEVFGLAGSNGSGKSTIVRILSGYYAPDKGAEIAISGHRLPLPISAEDARHHGMRFVHQNDGFIAGMSVLDNMCLGRGYASGPGWKIRWREERANLTAALEQHAVSVDLDSDASTLSVVTKAKLAIIRALQRRGNEALRLVVLDEPTASMDKQEASRLCAWLRELAASEQCGVLFIGHRPQELREVADRIGVLRSGKIVATFRSSEASDTSIVEAMVGASIGSFYPDRLGTVRDGRPVLQVSNVRGGSVIDMSLSLYRGEIVGITGLLGSGFDELPYLIFDRERRAGGILTQNGIQVDISKARVSDHLKRGLVLVPSDRARNSVVAGLTVRENITQPRLPEFRRYGLLRSRLEASDAESVASSFRVSPPDTNLKLGVLSGGNQQKVVVGKWMTMRPQVILLHEPTEGVDVEAKKEIFSLLIASAREGASLLIGSIEYEDMAHLCNRILICGHGKIRMELTGDDCSGEDILRAAYSASMITEKPEQQVVGAMLT